MSDVPDDLKYTAEHEWVRLGADGTTVRVGITDYAQSALGDVVYVSLPTVGSTVDAGGAFGDGGAAWGLLNDPFHPNGAGHAMLALEFATSVEFPAHLPTMRHLEERVDARPRSAGTGLTRSGHGIRP